MLGYKKKNEDRRGVGIYLNIRNGKIIRKDKDGLLEETFDYVEGSLESIYRKDVTLRDGSTKNFVYLVLQSYGKNSERYLLSFGEWNPILFSLLMNLAGDPDLNGLSTIRIEAYELAGKTKVSVFDNGNRLSWINLQVPQGEEAKRLFVSGLIDRIQKKI